MMRTWTVPESSDGRERNDPGELPPTAPKWKRAHYEPDSQESPETLVL